jgi:hypothetical protein
VVAKLQNDRERAFEHRLGKEEDNAEIGMEVAYGLAYESTPYEKE